jgi:hypothetical protein
LETSSHPSAIAGLFSLSLIGGFVYIAKERAIIGSSLKLEQNDWAA